MIKSLDSPSSRLLLALLLALAAAAAFTLAACLPQEVDIDQQQYCEMVTMFKHDPTRTTGWPDFNHNYNTVCKGEKHAR